MGLLDKFLSKVTKDKVNDLVNEATKKINEAIDDFKQGVKDGEKKVQDEGKEAVQTAAAKAEELKEGAGELYDENGYKLPVDVQLKVKHNEPFSLFEGALASEIADAGSAEYFADLIGKNLPGVQVRCNVPLEELGAEAPEKNRPVDVLLEKDGSPALAVMLVKKNQYKLKAVVNTMNACEDKGIPAIRFMKEFENRPEYVIGRIRAFL